MFMLILGIIIGVIIGIAITGLTIAKETKDYTKLIEVTAILNFVDKLKAKCINPECPWEDFTVCESDINEVFEEMVGED